METRLTPSADPHALDQAVAELQAGGAVAFPTDTVYGLGVLITNREGIEALYAIKERDSSKAIAVLLSRAADLGQVAAEMSATARRLAQSFWPGPLTIVIPRHPGLPDNLSPHPTVGVRMPDHPLALALMNRTGPLAVTSANLSGGADATSAQDVFDQLAGRIPLILDGGPTPGGSPSTVVDCTGEELVILRQGPISQAALQAALQGEQS